MGARGGETGGGLPAQSGDSPTGTGTEIRVVT